jgi:carboxyl-terminal processing protease
MSTPKLLVTMAGSLLFLGGLVVGRGGLKAQQAPGGIRADYETLYGQAMTLALMRKVIRDRFVRPVDDKTLIQGALRGMVSSLNDHSTYLTAEEHEELQMESEGEFEGVGIVVTRRAGWLEIVSPIFGSPASRAGIRPGDRIVTINGCSARDMTLSSAARLLRGRPGTAVEVGVLSSGGVTPRTVRLVRERIQAPSVLWKDLDGKTGYVRIAAFRDATAEEFRGAAARLRELGIRRVVLDLRDNGGGLLEEAVAVCDFLLSEGTIVSTRGRRRGDNQVWTARRGNTLPDFRLAVLLNRGSASAAEIVAGAVQDHGRGVLVGSPSYGKGSVQTLIPFSDGSAVKLTTARYHTPKGRTFSRDRGPGGGLRPDVAEILSADKDAEVSRLLATGEANPGKDPQLRAAIRALEKR